MFFGRQPSESPDELANRLQREGKIGSLERELQRYDVSRLSGKDKESYFHLWGIAAFQRQDHAEAYRRFTQGVQACPDSGMLLFSLGQEFEHQREIEKMFDCFDRCSFPQIPSAYMLAAARYAYLWNRPDKGSLYLKTIAEAYFALGIADDHFVYVRGLPFFGQTWQYLIAFAALQNDFTHTDEYFDRASQKLSDYDFDRSRVFYGCVKGNDYGPAIRELEEQLTAWDSRFPAGYQRVQLACLKARSAENPTEALGLLFNVAMGPNDFPWLKDVLTINRAWAHHRANDLAKEATEVDKFLRQQKLLFEPDHAVAFAFLPYQETLKSKYQHSTH